MYTPKELSKIYDVSLKTIYSKLKNEKVKDFVLDTKEGKRLQEEGFNEFQMLMVESRVSNRVNVKTSKVNNSVNDTVNTEYIDSLKEQIEFLKEDRKNLMDQNKNLLDQNKTLLDQHKNLLEIQSKLLLESKEQKEQKEQRKQKDSFWNKLFKLK
jgi:hypothetical protein